MQPPVLWGTEDHLRELFGDGISSIDIDREISRQGFRSADHYIEFFRTYFGPMRMAFARVGDDGALALENDLLEVMRTHNRAGGKAQVSEVDANQPVLAWQSLPRVGNGGPARNRSRIARRVLGDGQDTCFCSPVAQTTQSPA